METILELQDYSVTYINQNNDKKVHAVKDANFKINKGDSLGIVGESGSGKSTMAMALLRLLSPKSVEISGSANFIGNELTILPEEELKKIRWKELAVVFQKSMNALSPVHRIGNQIEDIYRVHNPQATKKEVFERVKILFEMVNLSDRVYHLYPHELSGGMLQRVAIALSLIHSPKLLILDEATTALDVVTQGQILDEIEKMEKTMDMTRIMITHDMSVVAASCNKVAVMYAGEFMEIGLVKDVLKYPKHPYTKGLLSAFPSLTDTRAKLTAIKGFLPDLSAKQTGCIFAPRCEYAMDICKSERPKSVFMKDGTQVRCHLCKEGD
jgi:peptide/nickel transport system ATP-binding protein